MRPAFTAGARRVLSDAQSEAGALRHRFVHTEHMLLGLLKHRNSATALLASLDYDVTDIRRRCERRCHRGDHVMEAAIKLTPRVQHIMAVAGEEAAAQGKTEADSRHILLGMMLESDGIAGAVLREIGLNPADVRNAIREGRRSLTPSAASPAVDAGRRTVGFSLRPLLRIFNL